MITHVIGSLPVIHDFSPTPAPFSRVCEHFSHHLNCGIVGAAICGCGSGASLEALPTPLGSTATLFIPPAFAGPRAIPLIGTFPIAPEPASRGNPPIAAEPACPPPCPPRANEAADGVKTMNSAIATFTEMLDMGSASMIHWRSREMIHWRSREGHVGSQSADTTKLNFRFRRARGGRSRAADPWRPSLVCKPGVGTNVSIRTKMIGAAIGLR